MVTTVSTTVVETVSMTLLVTKRLGTVMRNVNRDIQTLFAKNVCKYLLHDLQKKIVSLQFLAVFSIDTHSYEFYWTNLLHKYTKGWLQVIANEKFLCPVNFYTTFPLSFRLRSWILWKQVWKSLFGTLLEQFDLQSHWWTMQCWLPNRVYRKSLQCLWDVNSLEFSILLLFRKIYETYTFFYIFLQLASPGIMVKTV